MLRADVPEGSGNGHSALSKANGTTPEILAKWVECGGCQLGDAHEADTGKTAKAGKLRGGCCRSVASQRVVACPSETT